MPPINLIGDFGGGGMLLAVGILAAVLDARASGHGQVVDAAMLDGSALLMAMMHGLRAAGAWVDERGANFNDTGAHFYAVYETADGRHLTVGAMEPKFYGELLELLDLDPSEDHQWDSARWPALKERFAELFRQRTLAEWCDLLEGTDTCFAPVLSLAEAPGHPHNAHRGTFIEIDGVVQPAPAPRFSRTVPNTPSAPSKPGHHTREVLRRVGLDDDRLDELRDRGVIAWPDPHQTAGTGAAVHTGAGGS